jgi:hypothetical protein
MKRWYRGGWGAVISNCHKKNTDAVATAADPAAAAQLHLDDDGT